MTAPNNHFRLLIVDDNEAIHGDLKKILAPERPGPELIDDEALLFGATNENGTRF